ncbi:MAG: GntR family transcriptional regulator [Blautia sp.]|nr:GntR family transcriptional regulator [Blautia sp.]
MKWIFLDGIPIYQQIVQIMQIRIANGEYPLGSRLPAVRDLAMEAGVNPNTMQRALSELERSGIVHSERTSGRFVTEDEESMRQLRFMLGKESIDAMFTSLGHLGLSKEEIVQAVTARANELDE